MKSTCPIVLLAMILLIMLRSTSAECSKKFFDFDNSYLTAHNTIAYIGVDSNKCIVGGTYSVKSNVVVKRPGSNGKCYKISKSIPIALWLPKGTLVVDAAAVQTGYDNCGGSGGINPTLNGLYPEGKWAISKAGFIALNSVCCADVTGNIVRYKSCNAKGFNQALVDLCTFLRKANQASYSLALMTMILANADLDEGGKPYHSDYESDYLSSPNAITYYNGLRYSTLDYAASSNVAEFNTIKKYVLKNVTKYLNTQVKVYNSIVDSFCGDDCTRLVALEY